jgi:hypothetical protein
VVAGVGGPGGVVDVGFALRGVSGGYEDEWRGTEKGEERKS